MNHNIECTFANEHILHFAWSSCNPHGMSNEILLISDIILNSSMFHQDHYCNIHHPHQEQLFIRTKITIFILLISSISRGASLEIAAGVVFISGPGCYLEYL